MSRDDASAWKKPDRFPNLAGAQVHVWRIELAETEDREAELATLLAVDERERANRFIFPEDRRRYIVCRGKLRQILGKYLAEVPDKISFCYEASGKPLLVGQHANGLSFNVAHAADLALVAVSRSDPIGVDLEAIRPLTADLWGLAKAHFSPREQAELTRTEEEGRLRAFFRGWTRKEAVVKADGRGLAAALEELEVGLSEQNAPSIVEFPRDAVPCGAWRVWSLAPQPGFVGAVAAPQTAEAIECYCWD